MSTRTRSTLASVVIALLVVATWLIQSGGSSGPDTSARDTSSASASPSASSSSSSRSGLPTIEESELPAQAVATLRLIERGGPFPYPDKDGSTFGNLEGLLPPEPRGYYAEYTVPTPGERDRGARRIIAGDDGERYWTADHYESFAEVLTPSGG